jgi:hypothetical protein
MLIALLFPGPILNRFIKPEVEEAFARAYPAYSVRIAEMDYSLVRNRFSFEAVAVSAVSAVDAVSSGSIGTFSVSGMNWKHLLWGGTLGPEDFAMTKVRAEEIVLLSPESPYEFRCKRLAVSVPDSAMTVEGLKVHPLGDDEQFFAKSKFRETRMRLVVPYAGLTGLACLELLQGSSYRARSAHVHNPFFDFLVNKDKFNVKEPSSPLMPNEVLSSFKGILRIDSLRVMNGGVKYSERFEVGRTPAVITFDSLQVSAEGLSNHGGPGAMFVIHAKGNIADAGKMNVLMSIPIASPKCSFQYSGSLGKMDLTAFNSFVEVSDQMRIKAGVLEGVTFEINVDSGYAGGNVRGIYRDLTFASINKQTGSEKGLANGITTFVANSFMVRGANPDATGSMKIGVVKYLRARDDPFIRFAWFALRTGALDVVGM